MYSSLVTVRLVACLRIVACQAPLTMKTKKGVRLILRIYLKGRKMLGKPFFLFCWIKEQSPYLVIATLLLPYKSIMLYLHQILILLRPHVLHKVLYCYPMQALDICALRYASQQCLPFSLILFTQRKNVSVIFSWIYRTRTINLSP